MEILVTYLINFFILLGIIIIIILFRGYKKTLKYLESAKKEAEEKVKERTRELEELSKRQDDIIKERTREIQEKVQDLEKFNRLAVDREPKMIELKEKIERLKEELEKYQKQK